MQSRDAIVGTVQPKVTGATQTKFGKFHDALDLIIPHRESAAFFVTTSYEVVNKQER